MMRFRKQFFCFLFIFCFLFNTMDVQAKETKPNLKSEYAILIHLNDDRILYEKKANEKMYPASMTKVMSALVAIEAIDDLETTYVISEEDLAGLREANASVANFEIGEKLTYRDLLYGLLLPSGADAANALAHSLFKSNEAMVTKMNEKAKALHMQQTHFVNTSGLHDDAHYTTVYDMSLLLKEALKNDVFRNIFSSDSYMTSNGRITMYSTSYKQAQKQQLDKSLITGSKTGFTNEASLCLASYSKQDEEEFIMISGQTHSDSATAYHLEDAIMMYRYMLNEYERRTLIKKGDVIGKLPVSYASKDTYDVHSNTDVSLLVHKEDTSLKVEFSALQGLKAPVFIQSIVGTLTIRDDQKVLYEEDIMIDSTIYENRIRYYIDHVDRFINDFAYHIIAVILALIAGILYKNKKSNKNI